MAVAAEKVVLTGCLAPIDKGGLEKLIESGKANPQVIKTLKCKTVAEGKFRHLNFIRNLPPYLGAGVRVTRMSPDFREIEVTMCVLSKVTR